MTDPLNKPEKYVPWELLAIITFLVLFGLAWMSHSGHCQEEPELGPLPPYSFDGSIVLNPPFDPRITFDMDRARNYASLGEALVERFMIPFDAWIQTSDFDGQLGERRGDSALLGRFPLDMDHQRWYLIKIVPDNHQLDSIFFRFSFNPSDRKSVGQRLLNGGGFEDVYENMEAYAKRMRGVVAAALGRYLIELYLRGGEEYRPAIITGSSKLFWLADRDSDVTWVPKEQEIK